MSGQKPAANRSTLLTFKARVLGAKKGYGLLKKKRDALKTRFQAMLKEIIDCKKAVGFMITDCAFSFAKAEYATDSEFCQSILNRVKKPSVTVTMKPENCAGVQLPSFILGHDPSNDASLDSIGISCGGQVIQSCRDQHRTALMLLIQMASLQTMFKTLDEEIKMTSRRVNALECVVIPRLEATMQWIKGEMDEMEREEFFRVKKIVDKKKARLELEKKMKALAAEAALGGGGKSPQNQPHGLLNMPVMAPVSLPGAQRPSSKDKDVLF